MAGAWQQAGALCPIYESSYIKIYNSEIELIYLKSLKSFDELMNFGNVAFWRPPPLPHVAFCDLLADPPPPNWLRGFWMATN